MSVQSRWRRPVLGGRLGAKFRISLLERRIVQRLLQRRAELLDGLGRGALRRIEAVPDGELEAGQASLLERHKRYLVHVAGYNLGLIMRLLVGAGTPREFLADASAHLMVMTTADTLTGVLIVATGTEAAMLVVSLEPNPHGQSAGFGNALLSCA